MAEPRQLVRVARILTMCLAAHVGASFEIHFHADPPAPALPWIPAGSTLCVPRERDALLDFKDGLTDPGRALMSWRGAECCLWTGVVCSNRTGHVVALRIYPAGHITPPLGGEIRSSLLTLEHLKKLDLSLNDFGGQPIPELIGALGRGRLTYLDLSNSNFGGIIPPHLGNLSNLASLKLEGMAYGSYSPDIVWMSRLRKLQVLVMYGVDLSNAADWFHAINGLPYLTHLDLSYCSLKNYMPSPEYSNLTSLETLILDGNSFNTSFGEKKWLSYLPRLQELSLSDCEINGPIPDAMGNLTSIQNLYLSLNNFTGMVPLTFKKLKKLQELDLYYNFISMDVAELFHRLPSYELQRMSLEHNYLTGSLPAQLGHFSSLIRIDLGNNKLSGEIPIGIREIINLKSLSLATNNLHGTISEDHFINLTSLQYLNISDNSLSIKVNSTWKTPFNLAIGGFRSCILGPQFPNWLNQPTINFLDISNTSIHDSIPIWIANSSAQYLDFSRNRLVGMLPMFSQLPSLVMLDVSSNQIIGPIPTLPDGLTYLDISRNNLSGVLPLDIRAPLLEVLLLSNNSFSGTIPCSLLQLQQLYFLDLSKNQLSGKLPNCPQGSQISSITLLKLNSNGLSGSFPLFLQKCGELKFLDLANNKFSGRLPTWIESMLPQLALLSLRSNMFSGGIPGQLTRMKGLQYLDIACNNISGNIPRSLVNLNAMTVTSNNSGGLFDLVNYDFHHKSMSIDAYTVPVNIKGQVLEYTKGIAYMVNLDFSCNSLTGQIPREIGMLVALKNLNFSWNSLSDIIPQSTGELRALESFDLSYNELSGEIPTSLSSLTSLSRLNLSYNDLSGTIPFGDQLRALEDQASIYIGNPGLCGPPLPRNCSRTDLIPYAPQEHDERMSDVFSLCISMFIGFVVGLWVVFCGLLFKTKWRVRWFSFTDHMHDQFCMHMAVGWASLASKIRQG